MNSERPVVKTDPNSTLRNRNMTVKKAEVKPNNVISARKVETKIADTGSISFEGVNPDSYEDVLLWLENQVSKNKNFTYRKYNIVKIDKKNKIIELYNKKTGKLEERSLVGFINQLKSDIKNEIGDNTIDGKVITNKQIVDMIEKDIKNGRTFNGKVIVSIDYERNIVYLESNSNLGFYDQISLPKFIEQYKEVRKIGAYLDSVEDEQMLKENERQRNLEDMTEAFKAALGIKPPKVKYFAPLKIHRGIAQLPNNYRDYNFHWTDEEIKQVNRMGKTPNPTRKVDGQLYDNFNPEVSQPQPERDFVAIKEIGYLSKNSQRSL